MNLGHFIFLLLLVVAAAYLMILAGVAKNALEPKRMPRVCPSCGRNARDCSCRD
ncbi:MAG TPA: hypothetical protein VH416_00190 [Gaiellaceae bacterium]|jgi:hypothetical protein